MLFFSFDFAVFFLTVFFIYWLFPKKYFYQQNIFIVVANYFFYCWWDWQFGILLLFLTSLTFFVSIEISKTENERQKRLWLILVGSLLIGALCYFKYLNFFISSFTELVTIFGFPINSATLKIILPLGISFYTFQCFGYVLDVYWEKVEPTKDVVQFLAFSSFFPLILSGPVERSTNLLLQIGKSRHLDYDRIAAGAQLILWGLFKKVVIADNLNWYVNIIFKSPSEFDGSTLLLGSAFFMIQLYCDFSGYSDVAIGSANCLGFDLIKNFNLPFFSKSFSDFWRRWHISLTSWLFEYLYNPLSFSLRQFKKIGIVISLYVIFFISGLWHGANWTFIFWGVAHGTLLSLEVLMKGQTRPAALMRFKLVELFIAFIKMLGVFLCVVLAAIFFKSNSMQDALLIFSKILACPYGNIYIGSSSFSFFIQLFQYHGIFSLNFSVSKVPVYMRWPGYVFLIIVILMIGRTSNEFIYFQF
jgi:D-alanyl-lipoteichoic acid acyltransferase DltB (MBOAT superfamily)